MMERDRVAISFGLAAVAPNTIQKSWRSAFSRRVFQTSSNSLASSESMS
jgi:hypothetical protein